jgi:hypothetical protein
LHETTAFALCALLNRGPCETNPQRAEEEHLFLEKRKSGVFGKTFEKTKESSKRRLTEEIRNALSAALRLRSVRHESVAHLKTLSKPFFLKKHGKQFPFFEISFVRLYGLTV